MRQVAEFAENMQQAAKQYVSAYLQDTVVRGNHLQFMQVLDRSKQSDATELAECIDILLWEHGSIERYETQRETDEWFDDARHW